MLAHFERLVWTSMLAQGEVSVSFGPEALLGPFALLVGSLLAIAVLWREDRRVYRERIADLTAQRDAAMHGWTTQSEANRVLAVDVLKRRRRTDAGPPDPSA